MKIKTHKAISKRFQIKKNKRGSVKIVKRTDGQDHFNSRESGNTRRNKRSDKIMSETVKNTILRALPYSR